MNGRHESLSYEFGPTIPDEVCGWGVAGDQGEQLAAQHGVAAEPAVAQVEGRGLLLGRGWYHTPGKTATPANGSKWCAGERRIFSLLS